MNLANPLRPDDLLEALVRIDSRNPDLSPDSPGERPVAEALAEILVSLGMETELLDVVDGHPNVVGVLPGDDHLPTFVLESHLDTVPTPPGGISVRREGSRLYGRGACDTKGSPAGMVVAAQRIARRSDPRPTVVVVGAVDEDFVMRGAQALLGQLPPVDGVVIGEPTSLGPVRAHNGFIRVRVVVHGVAAHSSRAFLGVNAIMSACRCVIALEDRLRTRLLERHHPLTGPALLTSTMIDGGIAPNVVPDLCTVWLDRRLSPGESPDAALREIDEVLGDLTAGGLHVERDEPLVALPGLETPPDHPLVVTAERLLSPATGVTYGTDASYLNGYGGMPCIVLGPGSIDQAHTVDEWIELDQVHASVDAYERLVLGAAGLEP